MIDIPMKAKVQCSDGLAGRSTYVIVDPINRRITHLVVKSNKPPFSEYMVPIGQVQETAPDVIWLKCSQDDLNKKRPFVYEEYIRTELPDFKGLQDTYLTWPFAIPTPGIIMEDQDSYITVEHEDIPQGELAVHRGAQVEAIDGSVGQVDELLVNSKSMQVTHLILRKRHIFSQIERNEEGELPQVFADHYGWQEIVASVASVYSSLSPTERDQACLYTDNYGEAGAIDLYGPAYGLPKAISGHNSYYIWGPGSCNGNVMISIGKPYADEAPWFDSVTDAGQTHCRYCMPYENSAPILILRGLKASLADGWPTAKDYH